MAGKGKIQEWQKEQSEEAIKQKAAKGGRKSGESRRRRKALKEELEILLAAEYTDDEGNKVTGGEMISIALLKQRTGGSVRAYEIIRDTIGEKPADRVEFNEISEASVSALERLIYGDGEKKD